MATVVVCCAGLFVACEREPEMPKEVTIQNVLNVVKWYYPYEEGDVLTFKNESTGETWSIVAKNDGTTKFLTTNTDEIQDGEAPGHPTKGWSVRVDCDMTVDGLSEPNKHTFFATTIGADTYYSTMNMHWYTAIRLKEDELYRASIEYRDSLNQIYSYFPSTISLKVQNVLKGTELKAVPENAYVKILKHKGLTEFSLDGQSIWQRVK